MFVFNPFILPYVYIRTEIPIICDFYTYKYVSGIPGRKFHILFIAPDIEEDRGMQ